MQKEELIHTLAHLQKSHRRVSTIEGPVGVGKTSTVIELSKTLENSGHIPFLCLLDAYSNRDLPQNSPNVYYSRFHPVTNSEVPNIIAKLWSHLAPHLGDLQNHYLRSERNRDLTTTASENYLTQLVEAKYRSPRLLSRLFAKPASNPNIATPISDIKRNLSNLEPEALVEMHHNNRTIFLQAVNYFVKTCQSKGAQETYSWLHRLPPENWLPIVSFVFGYYELSHPTKVPVLLIDAFNESKTRTSLEYQVIAPFLTMENSRVILTGRPPKPMSVSNCYEMQIGETVKLEI